MTFSVGDLVILKSGSMRMCVEAVSDDGVSTVWCNDGVIGRDTFDPALLNKAEERQPHRGHGGHDRDDRGHGGHRGGFRDRDDRGHGGHRGGDRDNRGHGGYRGGDRDDRGHGGPRGRDRDFDDRPRKQGWDGKPRDKKYFRKDD
ncbi:MAG: hypothetical protein AAGC57_18935 [Pseudomonadota bacterium]